MASAEYRQDLLAMVRGGGSASPEMGSIFLVFQADSGIVRQRKGDCMGDKHIFCAYHAECPFFNVREASELQKLLRHLICLRTHTRCEIRTELLAGNKVPSDAHPNRPLAKWLT
jgi:hypothetical protein